MGRCSLILASEKRCPSSEDEGTARGSDGWKRKCVLAESVVTLGWHTDSSVLLNVALSLESPQIFLIVQRPHCWVLYLSAQISVVLNFIFLFVF